MEKKLVTAIATSFFLISSVSYVQAITLSENYWSLFGYQLDGFKVVDQGTSVQEKVYDSELVHIGYINNKYSGYYIGTVKEAPGQGAGDPITKDNIDYLISYFLYGNSTSYQSDLFLKVDSGEGVATNGVVTLEVTSDSDKKTGEWFVTPLPYALDFYGVKASTEWALYFVDPAMSSGKWSTEHLTAGQSSNIPTISHFAGTVTTTAPIPEPTTLLLFGSGLLGLAGLGRRKSS